MQSRVSALRTRLPTSFPEYVRKCFTIDTRSLALFRIVTGVLIVADILSRARNFTFYYTDDGVVTQEVAELYTRSDAVSVFFYTSDPTIIAALFLLHALVAIVLIAGYKTRLMLAISFLFVISLDHHNPFVTSYADTLFRMLLFWALFLPLGERWSIDALQRDRPPRASVASLATAAIMIQMVFMYSVNGQNKFPSDLWHSGEAAILVMGIDEMTFLLGNTMREVPLFLQIGGFMWFWLLLLSPLLIALYGRARYPFVFLLMGGHASFAITVRIGAFPYVAMMGLLVFLQPVFWRDADWIATRLGASGLLGRVRERAGRTGAVAAARLPDRLFDYRDRDLFVRRTITVIVAVAIVGLFILPTGAMLEEGPYVDENPLPDDNPIEDAAANWGVSQPTWSIFAGPGPRNIDRYYVFAAKTSDGDIIDIYNEGREMTWERPDYELQRQHDAYRKRFYMNTIRRAGSGTPTQLYAEHLCEEWHTEHDTEIVQIEMWVMSERITLDTIDAPDERERYADFIARMSCGDEPPEPFLDPPPYDSRHG